jgi:uncharacterized membrane protein YbhN (UPF0104 family)
MKLPKHPLITAAKWILAALAVALVIRKVSLPGILPALRSAHVLPLAASVGAIFLSSILGAWRWKTLLEAPELGLRKYLYFIFVGHFFNLFLPSSVAAEAVRVVGFGNRYGNLQRNIGITLVARGMGAVAQLAMGGLCLGLYFRELSATGLFRRLQAPWPWLGAAAAALALGAAAAWRFRARVRAQARVAAMIEVSRDPRRVAKTAALTMGIQALSALSGYFLFLSVFPRAPFGKVVLFILIIQAILMIPFSLGGVGVREYLVLLFFSDLGGMPSEAVLAANLLGYVPLVLLAATGGAWMLFRRYGRGGRAPEAGPGGTRPRQGAP